MIDLRPCPFCGGKAIFDGDYEPKCFVGSPRMNYRIKCKNCGSSPNKARFYIQAHFCPDLDDCVKATATGRDEAIKVWNGEA